MTRIRRSKSARAETRRLMRETIGRRSGPTWLAMPMRRRASSAGPPATGTRGVGAPWPGGPGKPEASIPAPPVDDGRPATILMAPLPAQEAGGSFGP